MLNKIIYTILGFSLAFVFFPHNAKDFTKQPVVSGASITQTKSDLHPAPEMAVNLSAPLLTAKAAISYDLDSGTILYSKNLDQKLPIASLTKLMTALVVVDRINLNSEVTINKSDLTGIGSTVGLVEGEQITVSSLLNAMLIPSGNDAALALADYTAGGIENFPTLMNQKAQQLNLSATQFSNPVGWDSWDNEDNFSSTLDLIKIVKEFLTHNELRKIVQTKETTVSSTDGRYTHQLRTTNKLLLDDPEVQGMKTGFTSKALGNLIILDNHQDHQVVTVILGSNDREADSQKLLDWTLTAYKW